ncbi:MAG: ribosomal protein S18-alanine N-acetyltransferase [Eubacteriaceae bacterium]|nr:ribosomal protein S18-alanine N-acetyltransferase [Eubacteriaceae bacterium]
MTESDVEEIAKLEKLSFALPWTESMLWDELENPIAEYTVMKIDGKLAGYGGMWHILEEGHITNIAVSPDFRKSGFGKMLLDEMIRKAEAKEISSFTLEVRRSNTDAVDLYKRAGFIEAGVRKGYYTDNNEDAIIMWRQG